MRKCNSKLNRFARYLSNEIGIEFKACMYFFVILFYYCTCRVCLGDYEVPILVLAEIIFSTYMMGYIQVYLMNNFDEGESFGKKGTMHTIFCSMLYCMISYAGNWFDHSLITTIGFFIYLIFAYICMYLIYKFKRRMDTKQLNDSLDAFKNRRARV